MVVLPKEAAASLRLITEVPRSETICVDMDIYDVDNHVNNNSRSRKVAGKRSSNWIPVAGQTRCKKGRRVVSDNMLSSSPLDGLMLSCE
jgi:hypothetical protein